MQSWALFDIVTMQQPSQNFVTGLDMRNVCPLESKWSFGTICSGNVTGDNVLGLVSDCRISTLLEKQFKFQKLKM